MTEATLQKRLDKNPNDHKTRHRLADLLEARNDPRAEGYRALAHAARVSNPSPAGWTWFPGPYNEPHNLRDRWCELLEGGAHLDGNGDPHPKGPEVSWRDYPSRQEADDAAAIAWTKLTPEEQEEVLKNSPDPLKSL